MSNDIDNVLKERGTRYGEFDEHARITQGIKAYMTSGVSWDRCNPSMKEALDMNINIKKTAFRNPYDTIDDD